MDFWSLASSVTVDHQMTVKIFAVILRLAYFALMRHVLPENAATSKNVNWKNLDLIVEKLKENAICQSSAMDDQNFVRMICLNETLRPVDMKNIASTEIADQTTGVANYSGDLLLRTVLNTTIRNQKNVEFYIAIILGIISWVLMSVQDFTQ